MKPVLPKHLRQREERDRRGVCVLLGNFEPEAKTKYLV